MATGYGDNDWTDELDTFCKKVKEILENIEIEPIKDKWNEDGNANP